MDTNTPMSAPTTTAPAKVGIDRVTALEIAIEGGLDLRSVFKVYRGGACRATTIARIARAARKLGLPLPPPAAAKAQ